ncbi:MAG: hypothetical protein GXO45_03705 [Aquificae bacterium]|nr:hypothetical protein [Aquificota bacterium]
MNLAFINFVSENSIHKAGILITDEKTRPLEFRITSDMDMDKLQEILYGETLEDVVYKEKFALQLLNSVEEDYGLVLTKHKNLLQLRKEIDKPVVHIQPYEAFMPTNKLNRKIISIYKKLPPLYITISEEDENQAVSIYKFLQDVYSRHDLMEPFNRIEKAIKYLMESKSEDKRGDLHIK